MLLILSIRPICVDTLQLALEYEYNLNVIKEIAVTESFLTLDGSVIGCQNVETYDDCETRNYIETFKKNCKCLPLNVRISKEVEILENLTSKNIQISSQNCALLQI